MSGSHPWQPFRTPRQFFTGFSRLISKLAHQNGVIKEVRHFDPDVIYFNSVACSGVIPDFHKKLRKPVILHVHELQTIIELNNGNNEFRDAIVHVDSFIAASKLVRQNLLENHGVLNEKVNVIYEYIDLVKWPDVLTKKGEDPFIIGGVGLVHWRKGVEFFIEVANKVLKETGVEKVEFWWIGRITEQDRIVMRNDLAKLGISTKVKFLGVQEDLTVFYKKMDILLLTSREDPFPVVALEAAHYSTPIVCWNQGIGTIELVERGCGISVDYLDTSAMAMAVLQLYKDKELRLRYAQKAKEESSHFNIENAGAAIYQLIRSTIDGGVS